MSDNTPEASADQLPGLTEPEARLAALRVGALARKREEIARDMVLSQDRDTGEVLLHVAGEPYLLAPLPWWAARDVERQKHRLVSLAGDARRASDSLEYDHDLRDAYRALADALWEQIRPVSRRRTWIGRAAADGANRLARRVVRWLRRRRSASAHRIADALNPLARHLNELQFEILATLALATAHFSSVQVIEPSLVEYLKKQRGSGVSSKART